MNIIKQNNAMTLTEIAYQTIKEQILSGNLPQGTGLSISEMAKTLNISRTPVSNACVKLEHDKLLTIIPKQGVIINSLGVVEAKETYELRAAIEFYSALRSFNDMSAELLEKQRKSYERQVEFLLSKNIKGYMKEDLSFHRAFLSALKNSQFLDIFDTVSEKAYLLGLESMQSIKRQEENLLEHKAIIDKLEKGEKMEFAEAIEMNILNGLSSILGGF